MIKIINDNINDLKYIRKINYIYIYMIYPKSKNIYGGECNNYDNLKNDFEPFTANPFKEMDNDDKIMNIGKQCFDVDKLYQWVFEIGNQTNIITRQPITENELRDIKINYFRMNRDHQNDEEREKVKNNFLNFLEEDINNYKYASDFLKQNIDVVNKIKYIYTKELKKDGMFLEHLPDELKYDNDIVSIAVRQNVMALQFASEKIISEILNKNGIYLKFVPEQLKNYDLVYIAIQQNGMALQFASDFTNDINIVTLAVQQNGMALQFASGFTNDNNIVTLAVQQNGMALQFASENLKEDVNIIRLAIEENSMAYKFVDKSYINNMKLVEIIVRGNGIYLEDISKDFITKDIASIAVKQNGMALQYVPDEFKNDINLVLNAVTQNGLAINYVPDDLKENLNILQASNDSIQYNARKNTFSESINRLLVIKNDNHYYEKYYDREIKSNIENVFQVDSFNFINYILTFNGNFYKINLNYDSNKDEDLIGNDKDLNFNNIIQFDFHKPTERLLLLNSEGDIKGINYNNKLVKKNFYNTPINQISSSRYYILILTENKKIIEHHFVNHVNYNKIPDHSDIVKISAASELNECNLALKKDGTLISWPESSIPNILNENKIKIIDIDAKNEYVLLEDYSIITWSKFNIPDYFKFNVSEIKNDILQRICYIKKTNGSIIKLYFDTLKNNYNFIKSEILIDKNAPNTAKLYDLNFFE